MLRIREIRETRAPPMSLPDLAARVGLDPGNLSRIERGLRWPQPVILQAIADALGVPFHELFASYEPPPPQVEAVAEALARLSPDQAKKVADMVRAIMGD